MAKAKRWSKYYSKVSGRIPREFFRQTYRRFDSAGFAIDLGCGMGSETRFLLEKGWQVLAVDKEDSAIQHLLSSIPPPEVDNLQTLISPFETVILPAATFIWAGLSLPFCPPDHFEPFWEKIQNALIVNGRFSGDFFGIRHTWASKTKKLTFHTKEQLLEMFTGLNLEHFIEEEGELQTALGGIQHIHKFTVCVQKR